MRMVFCYLVLSTHLYSISYQQHPTFQMYVTYLYCSYIVCIIASLLSMLWLYTRSLFNEFSFSAVTRCWAGFRKENLWDNWSKLVTSLVPFPSSHWQCCSTEGKLHSWMPVPSYYHYITFNYLLSVPGHCWLGIGKRIQPIKYLVMMFWHGCLSGVKSKWLCTVMFQLMHCHPSSIASLKSRMVLPFRCSLTQVLLENRLFVNSCCCL